MKKGVIVNNLSNKLIEHINKPAFVRECRGVYIGCNKAFEEFLGKSRNQIIGNIALEFATSCPAGSCCEEGVHSLIYHSVKADQFSIHAHQKFRPAKISKHIFHNENSQIVGCISLVHLQHGLEDVARKTKRSSCNILTKRELEVTHLMSQGNSTKEIARLLNISNHTIADYMKSIYIKLGVKNRISAINEAQKLNFI